MTKLLQQEMQVHIQSNEWGVGVGRREFFVIKEGQVLPTMCKLAVLNNCLSEVSKSNGSINALSKDALEKIQESARKESCQLTFEQVTLDEYIAQGGGITRTCAMRMSNSQLKRLIKRWG